MYYSTLFKKHTDGVTREILGSDILKITDKTSKTEKPIYNRIEKIVWNKNYKKRGLILAVYQCKEEDRYNVNNQKLIQVYEV